MSDLNSTLVSVLLIASTILVAVVIIVLVRLGRAIVAVRSEVNDIKDALVPLLKNVDSLTVRLDQTIRDINGYKTYIDASLRHINGITENLYRLETALQKRVEPGLMQVFDFIGRMQRGVQKFTETWKRRKG